MSSVRIMCLAHSPSCAKTFSAGNKHLGSGNLELTPALPFRSLVAFGESPNHIEPCLHSLHFSSKAVPVGVDEPLGQWKTS